MDNWIFFSDRQKLNEKYKKWVKDNPKIKDSSFNVITFLCFAGVVDEEKVKKFLEE